MITAIAGIIITLVLIIVLDRIVCAHTARDETRADDAARSMKAAANALSKQERLRR